MKSIGQMIHWCPGDTVHFCFSVAAGSPCWIMCSGCGHGEMREGWSFCAHASNLFALKLPGRFFFLGRLGLASITSLMINKLLLLCLCRGVCGYIYKAALLIQLSFYQYGRREGRETDQSTTEQEQAPSKDKMKVACLVLLGTLCTINAVRPPTLTVTEMPLLRTPPPTEARGRFAMLDDVRLLANGLLQLGQSLREFVHKTKAQINDIFQKLNIFDRSFYQLSLVTSEIKEEEEELKKTTIFLKTNNEEIRNLSLEIHSKVNSILQERSQLQTKVGSLEERLKGLSQTMIPPEQFQEISTLKDVIDTQERTIKDLLQSVREQHDQLNSQKIKIKSLEEKLGSDSFQETVEKSSNSSPEEPNVLDYLTSNSTNSTTDTNDFPTDCSEIFRRGKTKSGIYSIKPNHSEPFNVFCDISSDGAATVIQRRVDGSLDFDQNWDKYELGFGNLEKEFWLGLAKIYSIVRQGVHILNIQLEDWKAERRFVEYKFTLDGPASHYTIHLTHLSGNVPDALSHHTGMMFSTKDKDNDHHDDSNCALNYTGGWWFNACGDTNLNGRYTWMRSRSRTLRRKGIYWRPGRRSSYTLKSTKISIRPSS